MNERLLFVLTFASALGSGLIAGLFFAFSAFVMTALGRIPPHQGMAAMQSINVTILNSLFSFVFIGTALASAALAIVSYFRWGEAGTIYLLAGSLLYLLVFLVTVAFNVPLNDTLAAAKPGSAAGADIWARYLVRWTAWNHVRTAASIAALASFIIALRLRG
ncbi:anthrone oxygenase family protein [Paenibacillus sp. GYB003]|uniref:anthrone oxygenase family protein n=1 Tax=Paenibacillus sp. GYB003 TaxID=2994392 RepID=UPI002F967D2A